MKTKLFALLAVCGSILVSCQKEDPYCMEDKLANVGEVTYPATAAVGQPVVVEVHFVVNNGCGQFGRFHESISGLERNIIVQATYTGCVCTMEAPVRTAQYRFTPRTPGTHVLRFGSIAEPVVASIEVNG